MAIRLLLLPVLLFLLPVSGNAQKENMTIKATVINDNGEALANAIVRVFNKNKVINTNNEGQFQITVAPDDILYISAWGFKTEMLNLSMNIPSESIVLQPELPFLLPEDEVQVAFAKQKKNRVLGAVSTVDGEELLRYPDLSAMNALTGRVAGLYSTQLSSTPGWNSPQFTIRGLGGLANNRPLVLVDGMERDANELLPEEIESVEVLKDVTAKMLYGSRAADGVIVVTTKRGIHNSRDARINAEYGVMSSTSNPKWLDAAEYATLYNKARANDGLSPYYSAEDIAAYRNGSSPIFHPDNDYHSLFLNDNMPIKRITTEFRGGGKKAAYYVTMGYTGTGGYEDIKEPTEYNKFNVRGNLDIDVTSITSVKMDIAGRMEYRRSGNFTTQDFFGALSSHRPNEYPIFIPTDSVSYLGGSSLHTNNIYGMGYESGYIKREDRNIQFNLGLDFNLNKYVDGLTAGVLLSYDNENYYGMANNPNYASYEVVPTYTAGEYNLVKLRQENIVMPDKLSGNGNSYNHRVGTTWRVNYNKLFGENHAFDANFVLQQYQTQQFNQIQYDKFANYGLRLHYAYKQKYIAEMNTSLMGSSSFAKDNRFGLFPSLALGWIITEEDFLNDNAVLNYLKLKVAGGVMGSDKGIGYYLYEDRYTKGGTANFGPENKNSQPVYQIGKYGNPDLTWEKRREFNIGLESFLFNKAVSFEFNYFNIFDYDMIVTPSAMHPEYMGGNLYAINDGEVVNNGIDGDIIYHMRRGDFILNAGINFVFSKTEVKDQIELPYTANLSHLSKIGQAYDATYGYLFDGYLTSADIDGGYTSTLGPVKEGDFKYVDVNGDGVIDSNDRTEIGNDFPRMNLGLHFDVRYKGFGLYVLGVYQGGFDVMKNGRYFWNYGERKYSEMAIEEGYPLTATNGTNNFTGSDYWLEDGSYFKLKNVEVSYTLPDSMLPKLYMKKAKVFVRGTNLLSISAFDDLDPEYISAGIDNYPLMSAITGGVSLTF